jgi:hypothetical protein
MVCYATICKKSDHDRVGQTQWHKTSSTRTFRSAATTKVPEQCLSAALIPERVHGIAPAT